MLKKSLFALILTLIIGTLFASKANAAVDISLKDYPEDNSMIVNVDSQDSYLTGVDMEIVFSDDLVITGINQNEEYCTMGFNSVASNNIISIESITDTDIPINNTLVSIDYSTDQEDYYFYINQGTLDFGEQSVGTITDVNKPIDIETEDTVLESEQISNRTFLDDIVDFIREHFIYIVSAVGLIVLFLLTALIKDMRR